MDKYKTFKSLALLLIDWFLWNYVRENKSNEMLTSLNLLQSIYFNPEQNKTVFCLGLD